MKPVALIQHTEVGAPGSIPQLLQELGVPVQLVRVVDGEAIPADAGQFAGLALLGGYMGVHDDLPWIAEELRLIRQADSLRIPVIGHCLGSQLLATALGAEVTRGLTRMEMGLGLRAGLAIVAIAILLDRLSQGALDRGRRKA